LKSEREISYAQSKSASEGKSPMPIQSDKATRPFSLNLKAALLGLVGAALLCSCAAETVQGEGPLKREERTLNAFQAVDVSQSFIVEIETGKPQSIAVEADENLLPLIDTQVVDNTLKIANKPGKTLSSNNPIKVFLSLPSLQNVDAKGASRLVITGIQGDQLKLNLEGGHQVRMVGGVLQNLQIKASGAAQLESLMLKAQNVDIQLSGAASARIRAEKKLKVSAAGACKLEYKGTPEITQNLTGMSVLRKL
jgi:hypothetical protein